MNPDGLGSERRGVNAVHPPVRHLVDGESVGQVHGPQPDTR